MSISLDKLRSLVGMEKISAQFEQYLIGMRVSREKGMPCRGHMVLMGNPGTGKTTAARLFCEILHDEGLLSKGQFVHVTPYELIGQSVGETETKTKSVCESAIGGVLCIDEAHGLMARYGAGYDYAQEALNVLMGFMTSTEANDTIVMFVGYPDEMKHFIVSSDCGLKSRISYEFVFDDYVPEDLYKIFSVILYGHEVSDDFKAKMQQVIHYQYEHRDRTWGNAGTMQNYAKEIIRNHFAKHNGEGVIDVDCIPEIYIVNKEIQADSICENNEKQLKKEMLLIVDELQTKIYELQSKLNQLPEK